MASLVFIDDSRHYKLIEQQVLLSGGVVFEPTLEVVAVDDAQLHIAVDAMLNVNTVHLPVQLLVHEVDSHFRRGHPALSAQNGLTVVAKHYLQRPGLELLRVVLQQGQVALLQLGVQQQQGAITELKQPSELVLKREQQVAVVDDENELERHFQCEHGEGESLDLPVRFVSVELRLLQQFVSSCHRQLSRELSLLDDVHRTIRILHVVVEQSFVGGRALPNLDELPTASAGYTFQQGLCEEVGVEVTRSKRVDFVGFEFLGILRVKAHHRTLHAQSLTVVVKDATLIERRVALQQKRLQCSFALRQDGGISKVVAYVVEGLHNLSVLGAFLFLVDLKADLAAGILRKDEVGAHPQDVVDVVVLPEEEALHADAAVATVLRAYHKSCWLVVDLYLNDVEVGVR